MPSEDARDQHRAPPLQRPHHPHVIPAWRRAEWTADLKRRVSREQFSRFQKICDPYPEPFFLLSRPEVIGIDTNNTDPDPNVASSSTFFNDSVLRFSVSGSTQTRHTVTVYRDGSTSCTCMDARINCRKTGCVCKHVCFVLFRVLRSENIDFFERGRMIGSDELRSYIDKVANSNQNSLDGSVFRPPELTFTRSKNKDDASTVPLIDDRSYLRFLNPKRPPSSEDDCPVCYAPLISSTMAPEYWKDPPEEYLQEVRGCPDCGHAIHRECAKRWMSACKKTSERSCVMCRSKCWAQWNLR